MRRTRLAFLGGIIVAGILIEPTVHLLAMVAKTVNFWLRML